MSERKAGEPLHNIKHEMFASSLIKNKGNQTQAYLDTYKGITPESAKTNASRLLSDGNIRSRVIEIMDRNNLSIDRLTKKLNQHVDSQDERTSLQAVQLGLKYQIQDTPTELHQHIHVSEYKDMTPEALLDHIRSTFQ